MSDTVTIQIPASATSQTYTVQLDRRPQDWTDAAIYAPAIPGVLVALLGLWIAHWLASKRDRRKEVLELCVSVKDTLIDAQEACTRAWLCAPGPERAALVADAKSKLQMLGTAATDLRRRTDQGKFAAFRHVIFDTPGSIDVIIEVAKLRDIATNDPFEDPQRPADEISIAKISGAASEISNKINTLFARFHP